MAVRLPVNWRPGFEEKDWEGIIFDRFPLAAWFDTVIYARIVPSAWK